MKKTNAVRILDGHKIKYELRDYIVDENDLKAETVANKIDVPLVQVFKTLVVKGDKLGVMLACIPGGEELDLKALAGISQNKKVGMVPLKDILGLTGYIRGGVSPLGVKKNYPLFVEEKIIQYPFVSISAGVRGCQILIDPKALLAVVQGTLCTISRPI